MKGQNDEALVGMGTGQSHAPWILQHRSVSWLLSLVVAGTILVLLSQGAMEWHPFAFLILGPGGLLGIWVAMVIGVLGLSSSLEDLFGLDGPSLYTFINVLMGVIFWWALTLVLLLRHRRKLLRVGAIPL